MGPEAHLDSSLVAHELTTLLYQVKPIARLFLMADEQGLEREHLPKIILPFFGQPVAVFAVTAVLVRPGGGNIVQLTQRTHYCHNGTLCAKAATTPFTITARLPTVPTVAIPCSPSFGYGRFEACSVSSSDASKPPKRWTSNAGCCLSGSEMSDGVHCTCSDLI